MTDDAARGSFAISFSHIAAMTNEWGIFEHASLLMPRIERGYCTDDVARALTVVLREQSADLQLSNFAETYLAFLERAIAPDGAAHNRMSAEGEWIDVAATGDWWGRAIGGLGNAIAYSQDSSFRARALVALHRAARTRAVDVRASSFAAIGAAQTLRVYPDDVVVQSLLADCLDLIPHMPVGPWGWIEPQLRYANATLCDALIVGGSALDRPQTVSHGLDALSALLEIETGPGGFLSVTGSHGRLPADHGPLWDQQAIEPAAIADACSHAAAVTGDLHWQRGVLLAWGWFAGENDANMAMYDPVNGAGYDGLEPGGRNQNCGAESTLAAVGTAQRRRAMSLVRA